MFAQVRNVFPVNGSVYGGTTLTLTGTGFAKFGLFNQIKLLFTNGTAADGFGGDRHTNGQGQGHALGKALGSAAGDSPPPVMILNENDDTWAFNRGILNATHSYNEVSHRLAHTSPQLPRILFGSL